MTGGKDYAYTSSGTNSQGNHCCTRDYGSKGTGYHYSNRDGSFYYKNPIGSTYYDSGNGYSQYTAPNGNEVDVHTDYMRVIRSN